MAEANAYDRVMALKLAEQQRIQRGMSPQKVGQKLLRDFCGRQGFGAVMSPDHAASLVRLVEAIVVAERAQPLPAPPTSAAGS